MDGLSDLGSPDAEISLKAWRALAMELEPETAALAREISDLADGKPKLVLIMACLSLLEAISQTVSDRARFVDWMATSLREERKAGP